MRRKPEASSGHRTPHGVVVTLAEIGGYDGVGSHGDAEKQVDENTDDRAVATHSRDGLGSGIATYHSHVDRIERLLQYSACYQWNGECENFAKQWSVDHIHLAAFLSYCTHNVISYS